MWPQPAPGTSRADPLGAALRGDAPFLVLPGGAGSVADLDAAIARLDPARVATVRIRNPLATPLSPQRVILQLAPDDGEGTNPPNDHAGRLPRAVMARAAGRPSLLVVVEQAESVTPAAIALLQLLPGLRAPNVPSVRVAFHGTPAFHALLLDPRFRTIRDHVAEPPMLSGAETSAVSPPPAARRPMRTRRLILGVAAVAVVALLAAALVPRPAPPFATVPVVTRAPAPPGPEVATGAPAAAPAVQPPAATSAEVTQTAASPSPAATAEAPAAARARLFREFDVFVEARGLAGRLSQSDREALFQEYLARRHAAAGLPSTLTAAPPVAVAANGRNVILFFPDSLVGAEAVAEENAVLLRRQVLDVMLRPTARSPLDPTVNYFHPEDRDLAIALALALPPASTEWQVVDMSGVAEGPARPTVEVWLPRPHPAP